ncbi:hypothetical protein [Virgibacillus siamensis]|uniref:hypothetical protein n=1 Tax=Virgibacillus siamensis TaxID=480071 RepID=UPI000985C930|nr:hypothetical protein [Virgibacillus siamensis]
MSEFVSYVYVRLLDMGYAPDSEEVEKIVELIEAIEGEPFTESEVAHDLYFGLRLHGYTATDMECKIIAGIVFDYLQEKGQVEYTIVIDEDEIHG